MLGDTIRPRLFEYLGGIVRSDERTLLLAGGIEDHLHLLVSLPPKIPLSDHLRALKSKSSAWLKNNFEPLSHFSWQEGFGAFFREPVQSRFGLKIHPQSTRTSSR